MTNEDGFLNLDLLSSPNLELNGKLMNNYGFERKIKTLTKSGGEPIIGKFMTFPQTKQAYIPVFSHSFMVGTDPAKDIRSTFCLTSIGEKCPICDEYWALMKSRKQLKLAGKEGSVEYADVTNRIKSLRKKEGGIFQFISIDGTKIEPLYLNKQMIETIFGAEANEYFNRPATEGILKTMKEDGFDPFNLKSNIGWIKLYKTGMAVQTKFFFDRHERTETHNIKGKPMNVKVSVEIDPPEFLKTLKLADLPNVKELISEPSEMFSFDECVAYITNGIIPERYIKKTFKKETKQSDNLVDCPFDMPSDNIKSSYQKINIADLENEF